MDYRIPKGPIPLEEYAIAVAYDSEIESPNHNRVGCKLCGRVIEKGGGYRLVVRHIESVRTSLYYCCPSCGENIEEKKKMFLRGGK